MSPRRRPSVPPADRLPYRVGIVCLGNICRSPMAAVVLADRLAKAGLGDAVTVRSAGTGSWHVGEPMDPRAAQVLAREGYDATRHRGRQIGPDWLEGPERCDLLLAMDAANRAEVADLGPAPQLRMFRDFDPALDPASNHDRDVPDPWFGEGDGFETVLTLVERTCDALAAALSRELTGGPERDGRDSPGRANG